MLQSVHSTMHAKGCQSVVPSFTAPLKQPRHRAQRSCWFASPAPSAHLRQFPGQLPGQLLRVNPALPREGATIPLLGA